MAPPEVHGPADQSVASLVGGIVTDFQVLLKQQLQLTRKEIESDFRKAKDAASDFSLGAAICYLSAIVLCLMLPLLVYWLASPAGDPAKIPLWGCFGLVGVALGALGGALIYAGKQKMDHMTPLLHKSTQALEENLEWTTNSNKK